MYSIICSISRNIRIAKKSDKVYIVNTKNKTLTVKTKKFLKLLKAFKGPRFMSDISNNFGVGIKEIRSLMADGIIIKDHYFSKDCSLEEYDNLNKYCEDNRLIFMNHGYAAIECLESFDWLQEEDKNQKYSFNLARRLLKDVDIRNKLVLDIGSGRGGLCYYVYKYLGPKMVYGLDYCIGNIDFCKRRFMTEKASFINGDAHCLPFASRTFHVATNLESYQYYRYPRIFFREVYRVLKYNGVFCFADQMWDKQIKLITEDLMDAGFQIVQMADLTKNVSRAIVLDKNFAPFHRSLGKNPEGKRFFELRVRYVTKKMPGLYAKRKFTYFMLVLKKQ